jgi:hypothetical protein
MFLTIKQIVRIEIWDVWINMLKKFPHGGWLAKTWWFQQLTFCKEVKLEHAQSFESLFLLIWF